MEWSCKSCELQEYCEAGLLTYAELQFVQIRECVSQQGGAWRLVAWQLKIMLPSLAPVCISCLDRCASSGMRLMMHKMLQAAILFQR